MTWIFFKYIWPFYWQTNTLSASYCHTYLYKIKAMLHNRLLILCFRYKNCNPTLNKMRQWVSTIATVLEGAESIVKEAVLKDYLCTIFCFRNTKYLILYPSKLCLMVNDAFETSILVYHVEDKITSVLGCVQGNESLDRLYSITQ